MHLRCSEDWKEKLQPHLSYRCSFFAPCSLLNQSTMLPLHVTYWFVKNLIRPREAVGRPRCGPSLTWPHSLAGGTAACRHPVTARN